MNATTMMKVTILAVSVGLLGHQAGTLAGSYEDLILSHNPTHYWRLGEAADTNAVNLANPGTNDGTYTGGFTLGEPGALFGDTDTALRLDGIDGYVAAGNLGNRPAQGTIEFWMNPAEIKSYPNAFSTSGAAGSNRGFRFEENGSGWFSVYAGDDTGDYQSHAFTNPPTIELLTAGQWYHVVLTWDDTDNNITGYLNGVEAFNHTHSETFVTTFPAVELGRGQRTSRAWDGLIDEVAMYSVALTEAQVEAHYLAHIPEPSTLVLAGIGLLALATRRRRRR